MVPKKNKTEEVSGAMRVARFGRVKNNLSMVRLSSPSFHTVHIVPIRTYSKTSMQGFR